MHAVYPLRCSRCSTARAAYQQVMTVGYETSRGGYKCSSAGGRVLFRYASDSTAILSSTFRAFSLTPYPACSPPLYFNFKTTPPNPPS